MLTIKTWRDPYDACFSPTKPKEIVINPGLTVLVGCNGAGKTTLLYNIEEVIKENNRKVDRKTPIHLYNNLSSGGLNAISGAMFRNDYSSVASLSCDSEGEAIKENFGYLISGFKSFLEKGYFNTSSRLCANLFKYDDEDEEEIFENKRIILFDALDSGLSVDSVAEIREIFDLMMKDANKKGLELYIIVSANEYEMARNTNCFDVNAGKYVDINNYEDYRNFILKSRQNKESRIKSQTIKLAKRKEKEEARKLVEIDKLNKKIEKIEQKAKDKNRELTSNEKYEIKDIKWRIERIEKYGLDDY